MDLLQRRKKNKIKAPNGSKTRSSYPRKRSSQIYENDHEKTEV